MRIPFNRIIAGTLVLPTVLGALVLWSMSDRAESTDRVPTAVVNLDEPVTTGKGEDKQVIYAGRLLAGGLTSPEKETDTSLGWELTDSEDAQEGLRDGDYYAVLTIPENFSKTLSGIQGTSPETAGVTVQSNDSSSALVGQISHQVGDIATNKLGHQITATYIEGVLSQTDVLKRQLGDAADGADKLTDGAHRLSDGAVRLGDGADTLASGIGALSSGASQLGDGADQLSGGADQLAGGATRLEGGIGQLADGAEQVDAGANQLADGLNQLDAATSGFEDQLDQLGQLGSGGSAGQLADGVEGLVQLAQGLHQACTSDPVVSQAFPELCAGAAQAVANAEQLQAGLEQLEQMEDSITEFTEGIPQLIGAIGQASDGADQLAQGTSRLADGANRLEGGAGQLADGATRLAGGADRLADGADRLAGGADRAQSGASRLGDGARKLAGGADKLADGSDRLADGLHKGADEIPSGGDPAQQAKVISDPVNSSSSSLNPARDGATLLTPGVLAFALWMGAFVIYLVRQGVPTDRLRAAVSPWRLTWSGWWPALLVGSVQATMLFVVTLLFGADLSNPVGVALLALVAAGVFTAINQALVSWFGPRRGWIISIGFAALQVVSLGGLLPIDTAPGLLQALNQVLPVARAADALSLLTLGGQVGSLGPDLLVLLLWGALALAVTVLAARRSQRITLADVRRELAPA